MTKKAKLVPKVQYKRFLETARTLECNESEERFDAALKKVATHKPQPAPTPALPKTKKTQGE